MARVAAQPVVALDTEADSLHSYFDKVCLIQMSIPGEDLIIDPLCKIRSGEVRRDPRRIASIVKILHGADYDLRILNRDFGFTIANLIDTMVCSQLLGYEAFGLAALLERHFGFKVDKKHQRADWAMRPLPPDMLDYAATDTRHLIALADRLRDELTALGRWEWAVEEFARLEQIRFNEKDADEEPFRRLKGLGALDRRSLAVVRATLRLARRSRARGRPSAVQDLRQRSDLRSGEGQAGHAAGVRRHQRRLRISPRPLQPRRRPPRAGSAGDPRG